MAADVEQLRVERQVEKRGIVYRVDATLFRRVHHGAFGRIGETPWQFGAYSSIAMEPEPTDDDVLIEIMQDLEQEANAGSAVVTRW